MLSATGTQLPGSSVDAGGGLELHSTRLWMPSITSLVPDIAGVTLLVRQRSHSLGHNRESSVNRFPASLNWPRHDATTSIPHLSLYHLPVLAFYISRSM